MKIKTTVQTHIEEWVVTLFVTAVIFLTSPELLLNTRPSRYEAGAECGENIFGLLPAEPHGRESGDPHAEAAVSAEQSLCPA